MLQRKHPAIFTCHRREFHWVNKCVALARKTREKNSVRTNGMFVRRVRKPRSNALRWRREKKSCSRWTDLLPIYHRVEIRTEASARNRWQKFPLRAAWMGIRKRRAPSLARSQKFQSISSTITPMKDDDCPSHPDMGHLLFTDHYASTWSKSSVALSKRLYPASLWLYIDCIVQISTFYLLEGRKYSRATGESHDKSHFFFFLFFLKESSSKIQYVVNQYSKIAKFVSFQLFRNVQNIAPQNIIILKTVRYC